MKRQRTTVGATALSTRSNPDHHIWCNNGTYFVHVTLLWESRRKLRLRKSLKTKDLAEARRRRDRLLERLSRRSEVTLLTPGSAM